MPGIPQIALPPSLVLVTFLPPLIFAAAQDTSWAEMRQEARPILLLAVRLVLVTMAAEGKDWSTTRPRNGSRDSGSRFCFSSRPPAAGAS
jgi:hypothetical protein